MKNLFLYFTFLLLSYNSLYCQKNKKEEHTHEELSKSITNNTVIEAKLLYHKGETEKSLKKGLSILFSKETLTAIDSFHTYQTIAYNFYKLKAFESALPYAQKALEIGDRTNFKNKPNNVWIATFFDNAEQYDSSIVYLQKELERARIAKDTNSFLKFCNNLGWSYYKNNQKEKATDYYLKLIEHKNAIKYPMYYGIARGNYGLILFENKDYESALPHFKIDAELNKGKLWRAHFGARHRIAQCYFYLKKYHKSEVTLLETLKNSNITNESKLKTLLLLADVYQKKNQIDLNAKYLRKYIELKELILKDKKPTESLLKELTVAKVNKIESDLNLTKKELELSEEVLISKTAKNRLYTISLISILIIVVMYILQSRFKHKKNKSINKLEKELLTADLNTFGLNLKYKREFIDNLQKRLKKLQKSPTENLKAELKALTIEFNNYKQMDKNVEVFQKDLDKVNTSFFNKLSEKYPTLTKKEKEICGLLLLNLPSKDIAMIRNISPHSVKKTRQRIRKKLPISKEDNLSEFLESMI